jgi:2-polyprenyl-6-methoxyphenol hydroxylase-like FAD-dependent oxidoreductase
MINNHDEVPVLVVGGGLVGLAASMFLAEHGVRHLLVDKHPEIRLQGRARGINARTMEIYRAFGIADAVHEAGRPFADDAGGVRCETLAGEWQWMFPPDAPTSFPEHTAGNFSLADQNAVEPVLIKAATSRGAEQLFETELVSLEQAEDGVTAVIKERRSGQRRTVRAGYVIAADGRRSPIREDLGITRTTQGQPLNFVSIVFEADLSELVERRAILWFIVNAAVGVAVLTTTAEPGRWALATGYDPATQSPDDFTPDRCVELINGALGRTDLPVTVLDATPWTQEVAVADHYRDGRVFLAGDAAHTWSPAGGIGANTGVQDAHNLAWKLAAVIEGWAPPSLLDSYQVERHPVARVLADLTELRQSRRAGHNPEDDEIDDLHWALGQRYDSAAAGAAGHDAVFADALDLHGQPGTRAPHLWLTRAGERIAVHDLFARSFVLLTGPAGEAWSAVDRPGVPLRTYRIGTDLLDVEEKFAERYRLAPDGAVLIRPDGYVAWRWETQPGRPADALQEAFSALLGRRVPGA